MATDVTQQPRHHDLAEALVELSRAAQQRRSARRALAESGATVARAIRKQMRTNDECELREHLYYDVAELVEQGTPFTPLDKKGTPLLCRVQIGSSDDTSRNVALEPIPGAKGRRYTIEGGDDDEVYHLATADDYLTFAKEAGQVIEILTQTFREHAEAFAATAQEIAKLTPR